MKQAVLEQLQTLGPGQLTSYGELAAALGTTARRVAYVLARLDELESELYPWHRVVGKGGRLGQHDGMAEQVRRLQAEGVIISRGHVQNWEERHLPYLRSAQATPQ